MPCLPAIDLDHILAHTEEVWPLIRGERFFITGATGFVGTWLTESLLWANRRLGLGVSAVLLTRDPEAFSRRAPHLAEAPEVTLWAGDSRNFAYPEGSFSLVIHLATEPYYPPSADSPVSSLEGDLMTTRHVLELARTRGTRRLLFTSSGAVYGKQPADLGHIPEDYAGAPSPTDANSSYAQSKRISEFLCAVWSRVYGFDAVIGRLFTFAGPLLPLDANYAVGNFVRDVLSGGPVRIRGDGTPYRSYLYAADLAIWIWVLLLRGEGGTAYNIGSPHEISIVDLAHRVVEVADPAAEIRIEREPVPGSAPLRYVPATDRAARLGLESWIPLDVSIRRMCEWHLKTHQAGGNHCVVGPQFEEH
ncbi:MAG TPA: NAD-dependent epimerase/dehydratase family protein [Terracidiphilus sp.]|jgi:dTDP-glucose 4,6-dehydratase